MIGQFRANELAMNPDGLISEGYEGNVDVYSVIKRIVQMSIALPWIIERRDNEGNWEQITDSSLHELLANPNRGKGYTWRDIQEQYLTYLLAGGNSFMTGESSLTSTTFDELDVLPTQNICIKTTENFFLPSPEYQFELGEQKRTFTPDECQHIKYFNPSYQTVQESFWGLSAIQVAAQAVKSGSDQWDARANLLQNRGAIGLITNKSGRLMDPDEAQKIQQSFESGTAGTRNFGRVKVVTEDLNYIQMAMSSNDLQLVEGGVVTLRAICNLWGVDSALFNDPANQTYNNRLEAEKALYTNAIIPLSEKVSLAHTNFLVQNHFPGEEVRMTQDFSGVEALQKDKKTEAEKDNLVIQGVNSVLELNTNQEAKQNLLIEMFDFPEDQAALLVRQEQQEDEN